MASKKELDPNADYFCFATNICNYMKEKKLLVEQFVGKIKDEAKKQNLDVSYRQVHNWTRGISLPANESLLRVLTTVLNTTPDKLFNIVNMDVHENETASSQSQNTVIRVSPFATIIEDKDEYIKARRNFIQSVKDQLFIQLRTPAFTKEYTYELAEIMGRGAKVWLLGCDPDDPITKAMIVRRKYPQHSTPRRVEKEIHDAIDGVRSDLIDKDIDIKNFKVRSIPFFPGTAIYLADPHSDDGKVFAITAFYKVHPYQASVIIANKSDHPTVFNGFYRQFIELWKDSDKYTGEKTPKEKRIALKAAYKELKSVFDMPASKAPPYRRKLR